jgi:type VI secretion system protein ImpG
MDKQFLQYFERELRYIRELSGEFAHMFPKVAGRLGIGEQASPDPHVERLFQGFAWHAAGVHRRLEAEYPELTHALLEQVYPDYLGPTPSMVVVQFQPDLKQGALDGGHLIPANTPLRARSMVRSTPTMCEYRTAHAVRLWPIVVDKVEYTSVLQDIADVRCPTREPVKALLRVRLKVAGGWTFQELGLDEFPLYLRGADERSARLYQALVAHAQTLVMRWGPYNARQSAGSKAYPPVHALGFEDEHALLPPGNPALRGYRLLHEYFAFPTRFRFVELRGLAEGTRRCDSDTLELLIPLSRYDATLEGEIELERIVPFATPAINLFPRECDRVTVRADRQSLQVVPDTAHPHDFEIHSVKRVCAYSQGSSHEREVLPRAAFTSAESTSQLRYRLERSEGVVGYLDRRGTDEIGGQYLGSDVFLTLVDGAADAANNSRPKQLSVEALCTNRDLPLALVIGKDTTDFVMTTGAPVTAIRCVAGPSAPRSNILDGTASWQLISHLSLNYLSLREGSGGAEALREMLMMYARLGDPRLGHEVEGIQAVSTSTVIRPIPQPGPHHFVRGLEARLTCEEPGFFPNGAFTLASVLSVFFAGYASHHSFTETVLLSREGQEIHRWPAVRGMRWTY